MANIIHWAAGLPTYKLVLLSLATSALVIELVLRRAAPKSAAYRKWTAGIAAVGAVWTGVILSIVYFTTVSLIGLFMRLFGKDPLDRTLAAEPTYWRPHEPNPLGAAAAVRHQF